MRTKVLALAVAVAAICSTAALAAPGNKNTGEWFFNCGNDGTFYAVRSSGSGTSFHIEGTNTNFLVKSITQTDPPGGTFTNKGFGTNQNSSATIECTTTSPDTGFDYDMVGVITPQS